MSEATITIGNYDYDIVADSDLPIDRAATLYMTQLYFPAKLFLQLYGDMSEEDIRRANEMILAGMPTLRQLEEDDSFIIAFPDKPRQKYLLDDGDSSDET